MIDLIDEVSEASEWAEQTMRALAVSVHRDPRIVGEDREAAAGAVHRSPARIWA